MKMLSGPMIMALLVLVLTAVLVVGANSVIPAQDKEGAEVVFYVH